MTRILSEFAYGDGPRTGCWWDETCNLPQFGPLDGSQSCDVTIVGGGFTGVSAALYLARAGTSVVLLEAQGIGWGASGRNGGFCCLGGAKVSDAKLESRFGRRGRMEWRHTEKAAVDLVAALIDELHMDVDRHSPGEALMAHRARDMATFEDEAKAVIENYGVTPTLVPKDQLAAHGMAGPFHGAMITPIGFGLNPRKYLAGLVQAALAAGVQFHGNSPVTAIEGNWIKTDRATIKSDRIILATNGYSSEDLPGWMRARYMPTQSTVLVTRPLTDRELNDQGWTTDVMAYDTRNLLHYFRLLPDRRFLIGMRGGLLSSQRADTQSRARVAQNFRCMFPAWADVEITNSWSGLVCLTRDQLPFVGSVPGHPALLAGFAYHGNGVAMGTLCGQILADLAIGKVPACYPDAMRVPAARFPFGGLRRAMMPPVYAAFYLRDLGY
jgi:glycine/D-amino acid oxidase-like deaminating enzyme